MRGTSTFPPTRGPNYISTSPFDGVQAVDDDSVGDDGGDEENDEPVSSCQRGPNCAFYETGCAVLGVGCHEVLLRHLTL
jgi:hypothetical protein